MKYIYIETSYQSIKQIINQINPEKNEDMKF